ncbi:hypothetical protein D3C71_1949880 [compost metagenome]
MGADKVIAVSFDDGSKDTNTYPNIVSITMKSFDIMGHQVNKAEIDSADFVIRPEIKNISLLECDKSNYCATKGYNETKKHIDSIRKIAGL